MPKLKPSDLQIRRAIVRAELRKNMELEMLSGKQAAKKINMAESTYCGRLRETESLRRLSHGIVSRNCHELFKLVKFHIVPP